MNQMICLVNDFDFMTKSINKCLFASFYLQTKITWQTKNVTFCLILGCAWLISKGYASISINTCNLLFVFPGYIRVVGLKMYSLKVRETQPTFTAVFLLCNSQLGATSMFLIFRHTFFSSSGSHKKVYFGNIVVLFRRVMK